MGINENSLQKIRLFIYGPLVILSFVTVVGVAVMKNKTWKNTCPLYVEIKPAHIYYNGDESNCSYVISIAVIFQLVYLLLRMMSIIFVLLGKMSKELFLFSNVFEFIYVVIDLVVFILTFVAACFLSAGSSDAENSAYLFSWIWASRVAQGGAWSSTILWMIIGLLGLYVLGKSGKLSCFRGQAQNSSPTKEQQNQREMVDPASERFRVSHREKLAREEYSVTFCMKLDP